mmetsp:Transcript_3741/g.12168  ORF Transcript_3741/g.12168 Transcript_3741/m.12168 type:complete len:224 (+) Transcript_3741:338-1009(+)
MRSLVMGQTNSSGGSAEGVVLVAVGDVGVDLGVLRTRGASGGVGVVAVVAVLDGGGVLGGVLDGGAVAITGGPWGGARPARGRRVLRVGGSARLTNAAPSYSRASAASWRARLRRVRSSSSVSRAVPETDGAEGGAAGRAGTDVEAGGASTTTNDRSLRWGAGVVGGDQESEVLGAGWRTSPSWSYDVPDEPDGDHDGGLDGGAGGRSWALVGGVVEWAASSK